MTFQVHALPSDPFAHLFDLSDAQLKARAIKRVVSGADQGYPCRVSLKDAPAGSKLLLLNYTHLTLASPYRASHAIYVRKDARQGQFEVGEIPPVMKLRPLSLRAFGQDGMMIDADLADKETVAQQLTAMLADTYVAFVHVHNAKPGCFSALATRPGEFEPDWVGNIV